MSDGTINLPKRGSVPASPSTGRYKIWVDSSDDKVKYTNESGTTKTFDGDTGPQGPQGDVGPQGAQGSVGPSGSMTVEAFITEKSTVTLPNSTGWQLIYSDSVAITTEGNCYLDVSLAVRPHNGSNDMEFELDWGGSVLTPSYAEEHKDTSTAQSHWRSHCIDLGFVTVGTYDLDLYFAKESTGGTAQLKNYTAKVVRY